MCDKQPYNTYQSAIAALKGLIKRGLKKLKAYKCKECDSYHLASVHSNTKPHGYRGKKRKQPIINKKKRSNFIRIKVIDKELQSSQNENPKKVKLLGSLINLQNNNHDCQSTYK